MMNDTPPSDLSSPDSEMDFGALLDARMQRLRTSIEVGEKVRGVVTALDRQSVFVDVGAKSEGVLDLSEVLDKDGRVAVQVGDEIEAYCISTDGGEIRLARRLAGPALDRSLRDAWEAGIPVEGRVDAVRKGGFEVRVGGRRAFCPVSQIDLYKGDPETYVGRTFQFLIMEFGDGGRNLVLSRRALLQRERESRLERLRATLRPGDQVTGRVTRIVPFGAFVDLDDGVEGLIPVRELSWDRVERPEDVLHVDDVVTAVVLDLDWERERITVSLRAAEGDPWESVPDRYAPGQTVTGTVTRLAPFGAFVRLEPGVEGLVHVSKLGAGPRVKHPEEVVSVGDEVEVMIERIDPEQRRLSLTMDGTLGRTGQRAGDETTEAGGLRPGAEVEGHVESIADFGVFLRLPDGRTGLLHVSQIDLSRGSTNRRRALYKRFPPESTHTVVIKEMRGDRISLTLPETLEKEAAEKEIREFRDTDDGKFGNLGDILGGLDLS